MKHRLQWDFVDFSACEQRSKIRDQIAPKEQFKLTKIWRKNLTKTGYWMKSQPTTNNNKNGKNNNAQLKRSWEKLKISRLRQANI